MENASSHRIEESFTVSQSRSSGQLNEFRLTRFPTGDYGIINAELSRQATQGGESLKTAREKIVAFGPEEKIRKVYDQIKVSLLVDRDQKVLEELKALKPVHLKDDEKIDAKIVNIIPAVNNKTDLVLKGDKTWLLRIPNSEAKDLSVGQQIVLKNSGQGLRIENEKNHQLRRNLGM